MDREISAIVAKAGLPRLRYLTFANAPVRKRPDADGDPLRAVEPLEAPCQERPDDAAGAEAPPAPAAEAAAAAAARPREPLPQAAPAPIPALAPAGDGRAEAAQAPRPPAESVAGPAPTAADFPLLRAVDEQLRGVAAVGAADGRGHRAGWGAASDGRRPSAEQAARPAAPARADFGLAG